MWISKYFAIYLSEQIDNPTNCWMTTLMHWVTDIVFHLTGGVMWTGSVSNVQDFLKQTIWRTPTFMLLHVNHSFLLSDIKCPGALWYYEKSGRETNDKEAGERCDNATLSLGPQHIFFQTLSNFEESSLFSLLIHHLLFHSSKKSTQSLVLSHTHAHTYSLWSTACTHLSRLQKFWQCPLTDRQAL